MIRIVRIDDSTIRVGVAIVRTTDPEGAIAMVAAYFRSQGREVTVS